MHRTMSTYPNSRNSPPWTRWTSSTRTRGSTWWWCFSCLHIILVLFTADLYIYVVQSELGLDSLISFWPSQLWLPNLRSGWTHVSSVFAILKPCLRFQSQISNKVCVWRNLNGEDSIYCICLAYMLNLPRFSNINMYDYASVCTCLVC